MSDSSPSPQETRDRQCPHCKSLALREAAGLSQATLARKAGITREHVNRLEVGKYDPTLGTVQRLARVLCVKWTAFDDAEKGA